LLSFDHFIIFAVTFASFSNKQPFTVIIGVKKESLEGFLSSELSNKIDAFSHKAYKFGYSTEIDNAA